jgi:molecular chaperone GrpE (heat shock protein)
LKADSDSTSVLDGAKQRAIANYQKQLNQEKTGQTKTGNEESALEFNRLLDNPDNQIKRTDKLESQPHKISKPLGKYVSESYEHLRNLRMTNLFAPESIQGGVA